MNNKYSKIYNPDLGSSVTRRGREMISMCALTTEGVLSGRFPKKYNALLYTINEIKNTDVEYYNIIREDMEKKLKEKLGKDNLTEKDYRDNLVVMNLEHLLNKPFGTYEEYYMYDALREKLEKQDIHTLIKIYYKNNLKAFINLDEVKRLFKESIEILNEDKRIVAEITDVEDGDLLVDGTNNIKPGNKYVISEVDNLSETELDRLNVENISNNRITFDNYNANDNDVGKYLIDCTSVFINPYEPPEGIIDNVDKIADMVEDILCGYYWYGEDYIEEKDMLAKNQQEVIKNIDRLAILLIDTDSNILSIQELNNIIDDLFGNALDNFNDDEKWFTLSNLSTIIAITSIDYSLERWKDHLNILPEYRPRMNMKNEYLFRKFLLTSRKKNYVGTCRLKEGGVFKEPDLDIKGLSFSKSNFNQELCDNVEEIVEDMMTSEETDVIEILQKLEEIDNRVLSEIKSNDVVKYFDVKKVSDDPEELPISDHRVNAVKLWNFLKPDEQIEMPGAFYTVYLDLTNTNRLKKKFPDEFMDVTEFLMDRMRWSNENKLKEYSEDIAEEYDENINIYGVAKINEEDKKGLWFKGEIELKNDMVYLKISKDTDITSDVNQYIFSKFENKFRRHYGFTKTKDVVKMMEDNIMMINDGEHAIIKINPMMGIEPERMLYDVYEIYEDTYRLKLNKLMKQKGELMQEKLKEECKRIEETPEKKHLNKLGRMSAIKKKYKDLNKIAIPLELETNIPEFVSENINATPILSQTSNLIAPVIDTLGVVVLRDTNKRRHVTNIVDYY